MIFYSSIIHIVESKCGLQYDETFFLNVRIIESIRAVHIFDMWVWFWLIYMSLLNRMPSLLDDTNMSVLVHLGSLSLESVKELRYLMAPVHVNLAMMLFIIV
jgi:hypothetical protein